MDVSNEQRERGKKGQKREKREVKVENTNYFRSCDGAHKETEISSIHSHYPWILSLCLSVSALIE